MSDVFISYSRKDIAFARLIHRCFEESQLKTWIDWQDIPPAEDWLKEIRTAIEQSDTFVFIISSTSVGSDVCKLELAHAVENHKRIIPVVVHDLGAEAVNSFSPILSTLNWIFFLDGREFRLDRLTPTGNGGEPASDTDAIPNEPLFQNAVRLLTKAIQTNQAHVKQHTRLQIRALEWERNKRDPSYLLHGRDLENAEAWLSTAGGNDPQPTPLHTQYVLASRQASTRRQRTTLSAVAAGLVLAVGLGIFAWISRSQAVSESNQRATAQVVAQNARATAEEESYVRGTAQAVAEVQRNTALSRQLAAQAISQMPYEYDLSLLLSVMATRIEDNLETRSALLTALAAHPFANRILHGQPPIPRYPGSQEGDRVAFSPDGRLVAVGNNGNTILTWDVATGQLEGDALVGHSFLPTALSFSPDGALLASGSCGLIEHISCEQGEIILWDLASRTPVWGPIPIDAMQNITRLSFIENGEKLLAASANDSVAILDIRTGRVLKTMTNLPAEGETIIEHAMASDPQRNYVATTLINGDLVLRDAVTGEEINRTTPRPNNWAYAIAFSPNGDLLAAGIDNQVLFFSVPGLEPIGAPVDAGLSRFWELSFSPNGDLLAASLNDDTIRLINVEDSKFIGPALTGHQDIVNGMSFSPNGQWMASVDYNDAVILWNFSGSQYLIQKGMTHTLDLHAQNWEMLFPGQDNSRLLSIGCSIDDPGLCHIIPWDLTALQPSASEETIPFTDAFEIAIRPDGAQFGIWDGDNDLTLFDLPSLRPIGAPIVSHTGPLFDPGGRVVVVQPASGGFSDGSLYLIDAETQKQVQTLSIGDSGDVKSMAFSPDGRQLIAGTYEGAVVWWDLTTGAATIGKQSTGYTDTQDWVEAVALNSDGSVAAAGIGEGDIFLFHTLSGQAAGDPLVLPETAFGDGALASAGVESLAFLPDGKTLAAGYRSGAIVFWDLASRQIVGRPFDTDLLIDGGMFGLGPYRMQASPDGQRLILGSGPLSLWELSLEEWQTAACHLANRSLTQAEWSKYLGDMEFQQICE